MAFPGGATEFLQFVVVVFPDHTHYFWVELTLFCSQILWHALSSWLKVWPAHVNWLLFGLWFNTPVNTFGHVEMVYYLTTILLLSKLRLCG